MEVLPRFHDVHGTSMYLRTIQSLARQIIISPTRPVSLHDSAQSSSVPLLPPWLYDELVLKYKEKHTRTIALMSYFLKFMNSHLVRVYSTSACLSMSRSGCLSGIENRDLPKYFWEILPWTILVTVITVLDLIRERKYPPISLPH